MSPPTKPKKLPAVVSPASKGTKPKASKICQLTKPSEATTIKKTRAGKQSPANILLAMNGLRVRGEETPQRKLVARLSGNSYTRSFEYILGRLKRQGLVDYPSRDTVRLTAVGIEEAGEAPMPSAPEVRDGFRDHMNPWEIEISNFLLDGEWLSDLEVEAATNCEHLQPLNFDNL